MAVRYGTPRFLLRSTVRFFCNGTLVRYAFFVMVLVRYLGTLFELKIPDFSHIAPDFCMQRQKTAEADQGHREGGGEAGWTMTPGPMDFRGHMGFRRAHSNDSMKSACEAR